MSVGVDTITEVSLRSSADYLPRIRTIVACLADSVGMDQQETDDAASILTEACSNAMSSDSPRSADDRVVITLKASHDGITADVTDCGGKSELPPETAGGSACLGITLMRILADSVQFIKHRTGLTVRMTKRAKFLRGIV